jgi:hypothetical protein
MAKHSHHPVLSDTATHDKKSGDVRAVIETPKGSRNKYRYDPDCYCFSLATTLPDGMVKNNPYGVTPARPAEPAAIHRQILRGKTIGGPGCYRMAHHYPPPHDPRHRMRCVGGTIQKTRRPIAP